MQAYHKVQLIFFQVFTMARSTFALFLYLLCFYSLRKLDGKSSYNSVQERPALIVDILY